MIWYERCAHRLSSSAAAGACGGATVSLPGGCAIGNRPIDLHLQVLEAFGAKIELAAGYVRAIAPDGGLPGGNYSFPIVSVGATENALMAAVLARGTSMLHNAAREPEIVDLCNLLVAMGAEIEGIGTSDLTIHGVQRLHGATYMVMPDRIEAGSYACAAAITGGDITLAGARMEDMAATVQALRDAGVVVEAVRGGVRVASEGRVLARVTLLDSALALASPLTCRHSLRQCCAWQAAPAC